MALSPIIPSTRSAAVRIAAKRGLLPTSLGSKALQAQFGKQVRGRSVFMARVTQAEFLAELKWGIDQLLGPKGDFALLRRNLKDLLARVGYTPEKGFPGDEALDIPAAEPGSLQDLTSDRRLNLVLSTQIGLMQGASQRSRGLAAEAVQDYPAWELVRVGQRKVPRGSTPAAGMGWARRWLQSGGDFLGDGRMIADKRSPVWEQLGSGTLFDDGLDAPHPPFAFSSGMGWREISRAEAESLGVTLLDDLPAPAVADTSSPKGPPVLPTPQVSTRQIPDSDIKRKLLEQIKAKRAAKPDHIRYNEQLERESAAAASAYSRR